MAIRSLKSCNWHGQAPAMTPLRQMPASRLPLLRELWSSSRNIVISDGSATPSGEAMGTRRNSWR
eukprot:173270-Pyramimonas_sp.AAC.1